MDLRYDPGSKPEARGGGESVADVPTALHLEGEAADLVVGVGEGGDGGQAVCGDAAAAEL